MQKFTSDYEVLEELGSGRFGVVFRCKSRATGELYAVKTVNKTTATTDAIEKLALTNEPKALSLLSHSTTATSPSSYITRLHGAYETPTHLHLILDYCPHPTLLTLLNNHHRLPETTAKQITLSLLTAVHHCHRLGVAHRDIKPENILVDPATHRIKLCDFGAAGFFSAAADETAAMTEVVGSPYYIAPEVLERREGGYSEKVDVWSVGVVVYEMVAGIPPFYGEDAAEVFQRVLRGNLMFPSRVFGELSLYLKDFLRNLLRRDVSKRFSTHDALRHPWLSSARHTTTYADTYTM